MDEADYTGLRAAALGLRKLEIPLVMLTLFAGAAFLTKMCYLSLAFNTIFVIVFLSIFYLYASARLDLQIPFVLLVTVFLALQVDALGNFFGMYGRQFGPMRIWGKYDTARDLQWDLCGILLGTLLSCIISAREAPQVLES